MKKRIISLLLAVCMIAAVLPFSVLAAGKGTIDDPWISGSAKVYRDGSTLHVFGNGPMADYANSKAPEWYDISGNIDTIVIETGVSRLGAYAFASCGSLTNARLKRDMSVSGGAIELGENAMPTSYNLALELCGADYMPDYNNNQPWSNLKTHIVSVTVDEGVKSIGAQAFASLINLTSVVIPGSAEYIGKEAFADCIRLTDVTLRHDFSCNESSGTKFTIGAGAFPVSNSGFKIAMEITGTGAVPSYASPSDQPWALLRDYMKTLVIGGDVPGIGDNAFSACTKLTNVTMYFYENGGTAKKTLGTDWFREHDTNAVINIKAASSDYAFSYWDGATFANAKSENTIYFYNRNPELIEAVWIPVEHDITVKPVDAYCFGNVEAGYKAFAPYEITVKNTGNEASGQLHVELSGGYPNAFSLSKKYIGSLPVAGKDTFTVVPVLGMPDGDYPVDVVVSDENHTIATIRVWFTVGNAVSRAQEVVTRLYVYALGRPEQKIDEEGFNHWVGELAAGKQSVTSVAAAFYASDECRDRKMGNEAFVDSLYRALLNREADPTGRAAWLKCLADGQSRSWVLEKFCEAPEFINLMKLYGLIPGAIDPNAVDMNLKPTIDGPAKDFVVRLYKVVLGRDPDDAGLTDWTAQLKTKKSTGAFVAAGFFASKEYVDQNKTNRDFVLDLYEAMMNRDRATVPTSDPSGLKYWLDYLAAGKTRAWVFRQFCESAEFRGLCTSYGIDAGTINDTAYNMGANNNTAAAKIDRTVAEEYITRQYTYLMKRSTVTPEEIKGWVDQLVNGQITAAQATAGIAGSTEALNLKMSNKEFIENLYQAMMGQAGDAAGIANWTKELDNGGKRGDVINAFAQSKQYTEVCAAKGLVPGTIDPNAYALGDIPVPKVTEANAEAYINRLYSVLLGRGTGADAAGMATWKPVLMDGSCNAAQVAAGLASSAEFTGKGLDNKAFVKRLYTGLLGRDTEPTDKEITEWVDLLNKGTSRAEVFKQLANTQEFTNYCNKMHVTTGTINPASYSMG